MFCPRCGIENTESAHLCHSCGENLTEGRSGICANCGVRNDAYETYCRDCGSALPGTVTEHRLEPVYAGFWLRVVAGFIDYLVMVVIFIPLYLFLILMIPMFVSGSEAMLFVLIPCYCLCYVLGILIPWLYYAKMESSPRQGTLGKSALGIIVTDTEGNPITFGKATARFFSRIVSGMVFGVGYLMAGFTEKKQALHDMMAGCLVVMKEGRRY